VRPKGNIVVRCATTCNIVLRGLQVIDGVPVDVGDLVMVKDQQNPADNGVYRVECGPWIKWPRMAVQSPPLGRA